MAISFTNLTANGGTSATSFATDSVSPASNNLLLLTVTSRTASGDPNVPTVTGNGLTWVEIDSQNYDNSGTQKKISLFRALGASPSSGTITIDYAGQTQTHCDWTLDQALGVDTTGTNGSGAIVQSAKNSDTSITATSLTATLAAFSSTSNATFGGFGFGSGLNDKSVGSGFTALGNFSTDSITMRVFSEWRVDNDTTVDASQITGGEIGVVAVEIKAAVVDTGLAWLRA
jgi:hypothetical protein